MNYTGKHAYFLPHIEIFAGRNANVSFAFEPVYKEFQKGLISQLIDIYLDKEASVNFVDSTTLPEDAFYIQHVRATLKRKSRLNYWSLSKGSHFFKQSFKVELLEEESEVCLKGATYLEEKNVSHTEVLVEHRAPHAKSNQHFKAVMNDQSSSTFEGKIYVIPEAQKTEAYQLNNNLLLGSKSFAFSKPNLEIFADDVKASHGATVSNLSEEELFYFQARGISKKVASETLAKGFLDEIIKDASLCSTTQM
jgi:Fe-S cluster assembly protein SufD